jgi:hypothetical protein
MSAEVHNTMQRMGASRSGQPVFVAHRRLAPAADGVRSARTPAHRGKV